VLQDICPGSDEVIIVTSSLMKDMNSKVELYRCAGQVLTRTAAQRLLGMQRSTGQYSTNCMYNGRSCSFADSRFKQLLGSAKALWQLTHTRRHVWVTSQHPAAL